MYIVYLYVLVCLAVLEYTCTVLMYVRQERMRAKELAKYSESAKGKFAGEPFQATTSTIDRLPNSLRSLPFSVFIDAVSSRYI